MDINSITMAGSNPALSAQQRTSRPEAQSLAGLQGVQGPAAAASTPAQPAQTQANEVQDIDEAVSSIQDFVQTVQRNLNFSLDDTSGRMVVKVTDGISGEVIRQIPSEEALRLAESLEQARSLLFKAEA